MEKLASDQELIDAFISGDQLAFKHLVERHTGFVFNLGMRMLKDEQAAEEICQDAFMKVFKGLDRYRATAKFSTWLYTIAYRECLDKIKKKGPFVDEFDSTFHGIQHTSEKEAIMNNLNNSDRKKFINQVLSKIPPRESALLTLFYLEELSIKEIAEITDQSIAGIKVSLHRGRKSMYNAITTYSTLPLNEWI